MLSIGQQLCQTGFARYNFRLQCACTLRNKVPLPRSILPTQRVYGGKLVPYRPVIWQQKCSKAKGRSMRKRSVKR